MNKTDIEWADMTWNPVVGCKHGCEYCYARRIAKRFGGYDKADGTITTHNPLPRAELHQPLTITRSSGKTVNSPFPFGFEPTLLYYRLEEPQHIKKPHTIFVCSMADLFGPWVPDEWIARVFEACKAAPWHNYMFLTKYPERYADLANAGKLPRARECPNFWYGTTVTKAGDRAFTPGVTFNTFLSIEPISGPLDAGLGSFGGARWIIVGAETGNRKGKIAPERAWIENIIEAAAITRTPVLLKDSKELRAVWGDDLIQDFPPELRPMSEDNSIPHCKECEEAVREGQGKRGEKITCKATGRHARGRYTRSSPPWCPKRSKDKIE